jgi:hypothetical protein
LAAKVSAALVYSVRRWRSSGRHPIWKQHAIEVVALVLNDPRFKPLDLPVDLLAAR